MRDVLLFAGPTLHGLAPGLVEDAGVRLCPPVVRGDIDAAREAGEPGVMVVCDGVFQRTPAVSHAELCRALDAGWQVWGVSSIGAIRAHELRAQGMRGFGDVHAMFARFEDFTDDEVCLLHYPEPPWFPLSEPLVNLRHALERHGPALGIAPAAADAVLHEMRELWFGDRTTGSIRASMNHAGVAPTVADALLARVRDDPVKQSDLKALLTLQPWRRPAAG